MPFRSSGACCPAAAAIPGPLRVRQGSGAAVRAALGGFAASFGQQRGGFVAAAWGARGGFLRATAFGMRGAERAPHLGTRPQKTATLRASAGACLRYVGRCARPTPRHAPALSLPPVLRPVRAPLPAARAIVPSLGFAPTQHPCKRLRHLRCGAGRNVAGWSVSACGASPSRHAAPAPSASAAFATCTGAVLRRRHKTAALLPKTRRKPAQRSANGSA